VASDPEQLQEARGVRTARMIAPDAARLVRSTAMHVLPSPVTKIARAVHRREGTDQNGPRCGGGVCPRATPHGAVDACLFGVRLRPWRQGHLPDSKALH
jgi:hypothetical protein